MSSDRATSQRRAEDVGEQAQPRTPVFPGQRDILHQADRTTRPVSSRPSSAASYPSTTTTSSISTTIHTANDSSPQYCTRPPPPYQNNDALHSSLRPTSSTSNRGYQLPSAASIGSVQTGPSNYLRRESQRLTSPQYHGRHYQSGVGHGDIPVVAGPSTDPHNTGASSHGNMMAGRAPSRQLRRYLRTEEVPGEGSFHFYNDGYRIPAEVHGEVVNPAWGLTKANKPRKRLALACISCRNKKIKCDPGMHGCLQCERAQIPCRRGSKRFGLPEGEEEYEAHDYVPDSLSHHTPT